MLTQILSILVSNRWAITPPALEMFLSVVQRQDVSSENISRALHGEQWSRYIKDGVPRVPAMLEATDYGILEGTSSVSQTGNVAVLPVFGPIIPRATLFSGMSGISSLQAITYDFNVALNDPSIETIILYVDSPGGQVTGIGEFANMVYEARDKKNIITYVYGYGASAAYWIGTASSKMYLSPTAEVGSIGVVTLYTLDRKQKEKKGIEEYEIVSTGAPNKRPDVSTNSGRAQILEVLDSLESVMVADIARNRGVSIDDVYARFGQGKLVVGQDAINVGMADEIGSLESVIQTYKSQTIIQTYGGYMNLQELKDKHPATYMEAIQIGKAEGIEEGKKLGATEAKEKADADISEAKKAGAKEENARIQAIEGLAIPSGYEKVVAENKFDMSQTKDTVAGKVLEAQSAKKSEMSKQLKSDGSGLSDTLSNVGTQSSENADSDDNERKALVKAAVDRANSNR